MKIIFMGTPAFAEPILNMLIETFEVLAVITQPDQQVGRKKVMMMSPVKTLALKHDIPVLQPLKLKDAIDDVLAYNADIYITAAYGQFVPLGILKHKPCINVHGSLLPKYRGGAPIQYAIKDGLKETGVTIMHMVKKMDAGAIIKQQSMPIEAEDTYTTLSSKMSLIGAQVLKEVLETYGTQLPSGCPQDEKEVTFAYTLKREDERLSFHASAQAFIDHMHALKDQPIGHIIHRGIPIKIYEAKKSDIISNKAPGTIILSKKTLTICCREGAVDILALQLPGKKRLSIEAFLNGQNMFQDGQIIEESL